MFKVDVVIPSYNRIDYIFQTIESVLNQTLKPCNILVIDDNSDYDVSEFEDKISDIDLCGVNVIYLRNSENMGACYSRNRGAKTSEAEYVAFLDDDDLWESEHLDNLLSALLNDNSDLAYSAKKIKDFESGKQRLSYNEIPNKNQFQSLLKCNYPGSTSSILVNRLKMLDVGGFDEQLPAIQDYDFYLRFSKIGKIIPCPEPTLIYRNDTPLKITNQINKAINAAQVIISKYEGDDKKRLNRTLTIQNIKKSIRYLKFSFVFIIFYNYLINRLK